MVVIFNWIDSYLNDYSTDISFEEWNFLNVVVVNNLVIFDFSKYVDFRSFNDYF